MIPSEKTCAAQRAVGLLGFGISNRAVLKKLAPLLPDVTFLIRTERPVTDRKDLPEGAAIRFLSGCEMLSHPAEEVLFVSPSIRRDDARLSPFRKRGIFLSSDAELFFEGLSPFGIPPHRGRVLGVSGSDGKSSVTSLSARMLGAGAVPCGNFGCGFSPVPEDTAAVAELSSFQLLPFCPKTERALITNITENHLNYHKDFAEYAGSKEHLFEGAGKRVLCEQASGVDALLAKDPLFCLCRNENAPKHEPKKLCCPPEHLLTLSGRSLFLDGEPYASLEGALLHTACSEENFLLAAGLTLGLASPARVEEVVRSFPGLPHRCEKVAEHGGVSFFDSSIDSTPQRTAKTLSGMVTPPIVILGGREKGTSRAPLLAALKRSARAAVLLGENRETLARELTAAAIPYRTAENMDSAVALAAEMAEGVCDVLLSPAATSYDLYENFEARGAAFANAARAFCHSSKTITE